MNPHGGSALTAARVVGFAGALVVATACSDAAIQPGSRDSGASSATTPAPTETGSPPAVASEWRTWRGAIGVDAAGWVSEGDSASEVLASFWLDGVEACTVATDVVSVASGAAPAGPTVYAWWDLQLVRPKDRTDCPGPLPSTLGLGIGAMDADLLPALADLELDPSNLFGLYVQEDGGPVWVLGVAGTAEQFAGERPASVADGLPPGAYQFEGVFLISVGSASGTEDDVGTR